jgi:hypothetical protein
MPSRDGFILLFGVKQVVSEAPGKSVISTCPACGPLARAHLVQGDANAALAWVETALERNDSLAEAYYVKAAGHLAASRPDYASAVTAARAARAGGFPGADELLREAEAKARG